MLSIVDSDIENGQYFEAYNILNALIDIPDFTLLTEANSKMSQFQQNGEYFHYIADKIEDANLYPFKHWDGKYGYTNSTGTVVIEPQFDYVELFSEGWAMVSQNNKYHFINRNGEIVLSEVDENDLEIEFLGNLSHGLIRAKINSSSNDWWGEGFINKSGEVVIPPGIHGITIYHDDFKEGYVLAEVGYRNLGFLDTNGDWFLEPQFDEAHSFNEGMAAVKYDLNGLWGYVSTDGTKHRPIFEDVPALTIGDYHNGLVLGFKSETEKYVYIDKEGHEVINLTDMFPDIRIWELIDELGSSFSEGLATIQYNASVTAGYENFEAVKTAIIDTAGNIVMEVPNQAPLKESSLGTWFGTVGLYQDGTIPLIMSDTKVGFMDYFGNMTLEPIHDESPQFYINQNAINGLYYVTFTDDIDGYVDRYGQIVFKP